MPNIKKLNPKKTTPIKYVMVINITQYLFV